MIRCQPVQTLKKSKVVQLGHHSIKVASNSDLLHGARSPKNLEQHPIHICISLYTTERLIYVGGKTKNRSDTIAICVRGGFYLILSVFSLIYKKNTSSLSSSDMGKNSCNFFPYQGPSKFLRRSSPVWENSSTKSPWRKFE